MVSAQCGNIASAQSFWTATTRPSVIGRLHEPLIKPGSGEREGYVPNVVYTCGGLIHRGRLILPYAVSDSATSFAVVKLDELIGAMRPVR